MNFAPFSLLLGFLCYMISSCSQESQEGETLGGGERNSSVHSSSSGILTPALQGRFQESESNYSVDLSSSGVISVDEATFSEMIDVNENGQCFDKQTGDLIEGQFRVFSQDGSLLSVTSFRNGFYHGKREDYHENGVASVSSSYLYGKKDGKEEWHAEDGIKTYEATFKQDLIEGWETTWNEDGVVISQYRFEGGQVVERLVENGISVSQ